MANAVDKEQIEMLKEWWNSYGKILTIAIIIGVAIGFAWRYWHKFQLNQSAHASQLYGQVQMAATQGNSKKAEGIAAILMKDYADTPYAAMAALFSAQSAVMDKDYKKAQSELRWVMTQGKVKQLQQLARVRLARILLAQNQAQQALAVIKKAKGNTYKAMASEVTGDIYHALGDAAKAQHYYAQAQQEYSVASLDSPFIEMKIAE